ncbi:MAG TPA: hypothetical protein VFJ14_06755 [Nocardioidaceae bacterium]|nr:hypothetical protein [Nocardioidaceae bacterium]
MSPDDPRHGTNAGYLAHWHDHEPVCDACDVARFRFRKRVHLERLSGVQMLYTAEEVRTLLRPWLAMGITPTAIATAAGMDTQRGGRIASVLRENGIVRRGTFQRLAAITEDDFADGAPILAALTQQRIFSLMAAGHRLNAMPINNNGHWRTRERLNIGTARAIRDYYRAHEAKVGPDRHTMTRARNAGHLPPLAWDDPGTLAWPNPDKRTHARRRPPTVVLDEAVVARILAGESIRATKAERDEAMRRWRAAGGSEAELCRRMGWRAGRYGRTAA